MSADVVPIDGGGGGSGGSSGGGSGTHNPQYSGSDYVNLYFRQSKSSSAGKIRIQIRAYFYYPSLNTWDTRETANLQVYLGSNASGTKLLDMDFDWIRWYSSGWKATYSNWFDLPEQNNTSNLNLYALCTSNKNGHNYAPFELSLSGIKNSHTLTIETDGNISSYSYTIDDSSGINGEKRINQTATTAIVYDTDKVTWTATPKAGHKLDPASGTETVSGSNLLISIIAKARATIHMMKAGAWHLYSIYVRRGGAWVQHQANIRKAGSWGQYS